MPLPGGKLVYEATTRTDTLIPLIARQGSKPQKNEEEDLLPPFFSESRSFRLPNQARILRFAFAKADRTPLFGQGALRKIRPR